MVPQARVRQLGHFKGLNVERPALECEYPHVLVGQYRPCGVCDLPVQIAEELQRLAALAQWANVLIERCLHQQPRLQREEHQEHAARPGTFTAPGDGEARRQTERGAEFEKIVHVRADLADCQGGEKRPNQVGDGERPGARPAGSQEKRRRSNEKQERERVADPAQVPPQPAHLEGVDVSRDNVEVKAATGRQVQPQKEQQTRAGHQRRQRERLPPPALRPQPDESRQGSGERVGLPGVNRRREQRRPDDQAPPAIRPADEHGERGQTQRQGQQIYAQERRPVDNIGDRPEEQRGGPRRQFLTREFVDDQRQAAPCRQRAQQRDQSPSPKVRAKQLHKGRQ